MLRLRRCLSFSPRWMSRGPVLQTRCLHFGKKLHFRPPYHWQGMPAFWRRTIHPAWRSWKLAFIEFQHFGDTAAKMLVMVTPGGFNRFFVELCSLNRLLRILFVPNRWREAYMQHYAPACCKPPLRSRPPSRRLQTCAESKQFLTVNDSLSNTLKSALDLR